MAQAVLDAYLVSEACTRALAKQSLVDTNTTARKVVERLHALSMAASATPDSSKCITVSDDEFMLIASHWMTPKATVAHPAFGGVGHLRSFG